MPLSVSLPTGRKVDVGFLKLFLTTEYVDFSNITQRSPFDKVRGAGAARKKSPQIWDTIMYKIVQKEGHVNVLQLFGCSGRPPFCTSKLSLRVL